VPVSGVCGVVAGSGASWSGGDQFRRKRPVSCIASSPSLNFIHYLFIKLTMVLLVTSDNEQFVVERDVAERSVLIKNMLEGKSSFDSPALSDTLS
jgi:hypothetical protein